MRIPCLITGASGFLGRHLVDELRDHGARHGIDFALRAFDLRAPEPALPEGVEVVVGDVTDPADVERAVRGMRLVFHGASLVAWTNDAADRLEAVNVGGTERLLRACLDADVRAFVHTSSLDVLWCGRPVRDADESWPIPEHHPDAYSRSKARSERLAIAADGATTRDGGRMRSCSIRPCGMWGERDPYHLDNVLDAARRGMLTMRIGNGRARFQHVYVGNVAHAQVLAGLDLLELDGPSRAGGRSYFVTDEPAANFFDFLAPIVAEIGYPLPPASRALPFPVAYGLGALAELGAWLLRPLRRLEPRLTRNSVRVLCTDFTFDGDRIRRELGYAPRYEPEEARRRTVASYRARFEKEARA